MSDSPVDTKAIPKPTPGERWPSDRVYFWIQLILMCVIGSAFLLGVLGGMGVRVPRVVGFRLFFLVISSFSLLWWSIADRRFARFVASPVLSWGLRVLTMLFVLALSGPILSMILFADRPNLMHDTPTWYAAPITLWAIGVPAVMPIVAILRLCYLGIRAIIRKLTSCKSEGCNEVPMSGEGPDPSRRAFLRTAVGSVPMLAVGGMAVAARAQEGAIVINRHTLSAPWLPDRLRGLTITQLSDLHLGRLYRPQMLRWLVEQTNALDSDIVVVTGDIVDVSNDMLPPALHALSQLNHRHGLYMCIGNHDAIDDRASFVRATKEQFPLLINERVNLEIGGERLCIAGVDYPGRARRAGLPAGHEEHVAATMEGYSRRREGPMIALAHHPHAFDHLARAGVPLTLSGHTHGGQLMLSPPGSRPDIGIGRMIFRYTSGFYEQGAEKLFVNSGVGNWFPLRINAPAEIVQIQLV